MTSSRWSKQINHLPYSGFGKTGLTSTFGLRLTQVIVFLKGHDDANAPTKDRPSLPPPGTDRPQEEVDRPAIGLKDRYDKPERGEWMGADKKSSRRRWRLQQDEHCFQHTSLTRYPSWPSPRSHWSATGPRNQQTTFLAQTHQHAQRKLARLAACAAPVGQIDGLRRSDRWHRSDRWTAPVRTVATAAAQ
jgi:hypothetical protein